MAGEYPTRKCDWCGGGFCPPRRDSKHCTPLCRSRHREAMRPKGRDRRGAPRPVACHGCGLVVYRRASSGEAERYCSRRCNTDSMTRVASEKSALGRIAKAWRWRPCALVTAEVEALRRIASYSERPRLTLRPCGLCGVDAVGVLGYPRTCGSCKAQRSKEQSRAWRRTPSGRAHRKRSKVIRRARVSIQSESIDPIAVFDRDRWTCQLCGKRTPRRLRGKMVPDAPELDHIIPLALGGGHLWSNVQCACRDCNGRKGATTKGQLGLPLIA